LEIRLLTRWYTRPVLFVAGVQRALRFYVDMLGFENVGMKATARAKSAKSIAENAKIILCEDGMRRDKSRLFVELTPEGLADLRHDNRRALCSYKES
jgi:catechol 2,3-dioxygenase-like lactoylglutathione lyase family enzyme